MALAGGVLNKGESAKDLDLIFLPLCGEEGLHCKTTTLLSLLTTTFGDATPIGPEDEAYQEWHLYSWRLKFQPRGQRVDVFIV